MCCNNTPNDTYRSIWLGKKPLITPIGCLQQCKSSTALNGCYQHGEGKQVLAQTTPENASRHLSTTQEQPIESTTSREYTTLSSPPTTECTEQQPTTPADTQSEVVYICHGKLDIQQKVSKHETKKFDNESGDELSQALNDLGDNDWVKKLGTHPSILVVIQYPENHNPMLSLTLQQELDQMTPKEFLTYVHNDLTIDERESLLVDEGQRRKTFLTRWPHEGHLSGAQMAQAGFYYLGDTDHVQCVFCRGRLHKWSANDNPMTEHARLFNFCRFVKGLNCGNREYRSKKLTKEELHNVTTFGSQTVEEQRRNRDGGADSGPLGICTNRAAVIRYAPDSARLRTFARWPTRSPIAAELLCEAGFYYTGFDDQVRCFFCSGGIKGWEENDNPWEEHARWFPDCPYLLNKKGNDYVDEVHDKTPDNKKCARKTQMQKKVESKKQTILSEQEEMERLCEKLGHGSQTIERALDINGKPFESIKDMVEMLHSLETNGNQQPVVKEPSQPVFHSTQERSQPVVQQTTNQPGQMVESERSTKHTTGCQICERKTTNFVPATHVGLPCGHLIYCDSCKTDESRKSLIQQVKCPFPNCGTPLTGVIKVYFA